MAARDGVLKDFDLRWHDETALCVVMAAEGYPGEPRKGTRIEGLEAAAAEADTMVFHADTASGPDGAIIANGRSEEHTSELQSLMRISYAVFCLKKKTTLKRTLKDSLNRKTPREKENISKS